MWSIPKKPFNSLVEAAKSITPYLKKCDLVNTFPCPHCQGEGRHCISMSDYRSAGIYEPCTHCNKTGIMDKKHFDIWFIYRLKQWQEAVDKAKRMNAQAQAIRSKLTKEEISFVDKYGIN